MIGMYKKIMHLNTYIPEMDEQITEIFKKISKGKEFFNFDDFCEAEENMP